MLFVVSECRSGGMRVSEAGMRGHIGISLKRCVAQTGMKNETLHQSAEEELTLWVLMLFIVSE